MPRADRGWRNFSAALGWNASEAAMSNVIQITPFMHVQDLEVALAFFTDVLGFSVIFRSPVYAYVELEGAGIRIMENDEVDGAPPGNRRFAYYLDVRDVDALHAQLTELILGTS